VGGAGPVGSPVGVRPATPFIEPSIAAFPVGNSQRSGIHEHLDKKVITVTRTYTPRESEIQRNWLVIDAADVVLGRLASHAAALLRGKHKPTFAPHVDTGDFVIIVNAEKVALTGSKLEQKKAYRHSGYPGGLTATSYVDMLEKHPTRAVEKAIRGMLPKNSLGAAQLKKLKVYAGPEHPHAAQQPTPYTLNQVAQ
jgi:large subunit ribosomal protein L13